MKNRGLHYQKKCLAMFMLFTTAAFTSCKDDNDRDYAMNNQEFVTMAASSNNFEIAAGALAVTKGENMNVKHYGEHMVTDHTTAGTEMKNLSTQKGWTVPETLQPKEQANLNKLAPLTGAAFDKEFTTIMVQSHQDAVALFETASSPVGVPDGDLRALAAAKLPTLKAHLEGAITLKSQVNP